MQEGPWPNDHYEPKRFVSVLRDDELSDVATACFEVLDFEVVPVDDGSDLHFQALTLRLG